MPTTKAKSSGRVSARRSKKTVSPADSTAFTKKVIAVLKSIPRGRVASYQQIAELAGRTHASRGVAWILRTSSEKHELPWQRVIRKGGSIAFNAGTSSFLLQKRLLVAEGIEVARNGAIDLAKFGWRKKARRRANQPKMFS